MNWDKEEKEKLQRIASIKAHEHWNFIDRWLKMVYIDAFEHGFGHGIKEVEKLKEGDLK